MKQLNKLRNEMHLKVVEALKAIEEHREFLSDISNYLDHQRKETTIRYEHIKNTMRDFKFFLLTSKKRSEAIKNQVLTDSKLSRARKDKINNEFQAFDNEIQIACSKVFAVTNLIKKRVENILLLYKTPASKMFDGFDCVKDDEVMLLATAPVQLKNLIHEELAYEKLIGEISDGLLDDEITRELMAELDELESSPTYRSYPLLSTESTVDIPSAADALVQNEINLFDPDELDEIAKEFPLISSAQLVVTSPDFSVPLTAIGKRKMTSGNYDKKVSCKFFSVSPTGVAEAFTSLTTSSPPIVTPAEISRASSVSCSK